jgi:uncharacterized membrane protein
MTNGCPMYIQKQLQIDWFMAKICHKSTKIKFNIDLYMTKICHVFHLSFGTICGRLTYLWPHIKLDYIQAKLVWANIKWP